MEQYDISSSPVTSMDDLLAKIDMIIGAANQLVNDRDNNLMRTILLRTSELSNDFDTVTDTNAEKMTLAKKKVGQIKIILKSIQTDGKPFYS
jgi:hypothetical protein